MVKVRYANARPQRVFVNLAHDISAYIGINSIEEGAKYAATSILALTLRPTKCRRVIAYAASEPKTADTTVVLMATMKLFRKNVGNGDFIKVSRYPSRTKVRGHKASSKLYSDTPLLNDVRTIQYIGITVQNVRKNSTA
jgi:phosphotransferase system HPr-like phosphotransfer protein